MKTPKMVVFVVKRYAVREAKNGGTQHTKPKFGGTQYTRESTFPPPIFIANFGNAPTPL